MSEDKYTPMAWAYDEDDARIYYDDGNVQPTIAYVEREGVAPEQAKADGYLLASAPQLLEALKAIASSPTAGEYESEYDGRVYTLCSGCDFQDDVRPKHDADCVFEKARMAITKATTN